MWHTSEGNIRRWREEIASSIDEDPNSVDFCTQERVAEIKEILKSPVRENVAGDVVHIRSREHGRDDKWDYYRSIQRKVEQVDGLDWYKCIVPYCQHMYEIEGTQPDLSYSLSMQQLTELDVLISEKDKDFLERCRKYGEAARQLETARETCHKVYNECKQEFDNLMLLPESSYDDAYKKCFQSFGRAISRNCGRNLLAAAPNRDTVAKYEQETELLKQLLKDIHTPAEYVQKFHDRYWKRRKKAREELEQEIIEAQHQMLDRVQEKYPGIDLYKFALQVDSRSYWVELGQTPSVPMQRSDIDEEQQDKALRYVLDHYQDILKDIDEDAEWIVKLVQQPVAAELPDSSEKSETSVCEGFQTEGNGFVHRRRNEQNPDFSAQEQPVPDKEGLSKEFKRIFTLHNRFARDIVNCRALSETYHLHEEDVRDMLGNFQLELGALEHAVRKVIKSAPPDISAEDISRRVEVDDIEVVQAMIAKIQLDAANRPSPPEEPEQKATLSDMLGEYGEISLRIGWLSSNPGSDNALESMGVMRYARFEQDTNSGPSFGQRSISEIPEELLVQLLEIARKGGSS